MPGQARAASLSHEDPLIAQGALMPGTPRQKHRREPLLSRCACMHTKRKRVPGLQKGSRAAPARASGSGEWQDSYLGADIRLMIGSRADNVQMAGAGACPGSMNRSAMPGGKDGL